MTAIPTRRGTGASMDALSLAVVALVITWLALALPMVPSPLAVALLASGFIGAWMLLDTLGNDRDLSMYAAIPLLLSAAQNVYLGALAPTMNEGAVQAMLVVNFALGIVYVGIGVGLYGVKSRTGSAALMILTLTGGYAVATIGIFGADVSSAVASLRNLTNPPLWFVVGLLFAASLSIHRFMRIVAALALAVSLFGLGEELLYPDFWAANNVAQLWTLKGLPYDLGTGLPDNFYSSELIGGEHIRRMTSTFADPVNLGTFLFLGFMACWYVRWPVAAIIVLVAIGFTVSKGAMLGLLIFAVVRAKRVAPEVFAITAGFAAVAGIAFVGYSLTSSTQSLMAHVTGLTAAFQQLPSAPLGHGVGQVGVRATLAGHSSVTEIAESGIGVIVGQLGIIGLGLFVWLVRIIQRDVGRLPSREATLGLTLLYSIVANIAFNEVALSPNSSAGYFIALGALAAMRR